MKTEKFIGLSRVEKGKQLLRELTEKLAQIRATLIADGDMTAEEVDAFLTECGTASAKKYEGRSSMEIAFMGMAQMIADGTANLEELLKSSDND